MQQFAAPDSVPAQIPAPEKENLWVLFYFILFFLMLTGLYIFSLYFFFNFYLFMIVTHTEREREAETHAEGEAGSMHREPNVGFDPKTLGL